MCRSAHSARRRASPSCVTPRHPSPRRARSGSSSPDTACCKVSADSACAVPTSHRHRSSTPPCCGSRCRPTPSGSLAPAPRRSARHRAGSGRNRRRRRGCRYRPCRASPLRGSSRRGSASPRPISARTARSFQPQRRARCRAARSDPQAGQTASSGVGSSGCLKGAAGPQIRMPGDESKWGGAGSSPQPSWPGLSRPSTSCHTTGRKDVDARDPIWRARAYAVSYERLCAGMTEK